MELKDTLNLPATNFPMRANLVEREPNRIQHWIDTDLYNKIQEKNKSGKKFILHDGPPFTNGDVHIGTALNKILKDIILRYKSMCGFATPYIPGWDCHGLPIEHKVSKEIKDKQQQLSISELRAECAQFSKRFIEKQRQQFIRLGILADWQNEYKTLDPTYEASILEIFAQFVENGQVYRGKKPVYWSIPCQTALAEAEIEYRPHVSQSIYVKFRVDEDTQKVFATDQSVYFVIWTTTPWTIPANLAIAVNPSVRYVVVNANNENYVIAESLVQFFISKCKIADYTITKKHLGADLENLTTYHPIINRKSPIVLANYVTIDSGTGCVHTAPGHGPEDYMTGLKYNLPIYCPIDNNGCYVNDGQIPKELIGVSVAESNGKNPANTKVLEMLSAADALLSVESFEHSYPHCWRSKTPVIFRAMDQWFISLDDNKMRARAQEAVSDVKWIPEYGENRILGSLETRPDWCISRQRAWGVPLPIFFDEYGNALLNANVIRQIAKKIEKFGSDFWFTETVDEILKDINLPTSFQNKKLTKCTDTLDVWIDSGSSHYAVLQKKDILAFPADLYLEGSDQHRGWFQSSLLTSVVMNDGQAPYKTVLTHGFVVGEDKKKISKSDGKPQTADGYVNRFGADIVRLWIASEDFKSDIPVSDDIFTHVAGTYRTIRNTLRFQLGNLYDFNPEKDAVIQRDMTNIDRWILEKTKLLITNVTDAYEKFDFHKAYQLLNKFCTNDLSATYHDILKDRLYTYAPNWHERRSSQSAIYIVLRILIKLLSPILTFTADEAWNHLYGNSDFADVDSVHLQSWPSVNEIEEFKDFKEINLLIEFREKINEQLEPLRKAKIIGQSLDACIDIYASGAMFDILKFHEKDLPEYFIVSEVNIYESENKDLRIEASECKWERCQRSWRRVPKLVEFGEFKNISERCALALAEIAKSNE